MMLRLWSHGKRAALTLLITAFLVLSVSPAHAVPLFGTWQFLNPSASGSSVFGTFEVDSSDPATVLEFSITWIGGINFGSTNDLDVVNYLILPDWNGTHLSGPVDLNGSNPSVFNVDFFGDFFGDGTGYLEFVATSIFGSHTDIVTGEVVSSLDRSPIPEPATLTLLGLGLAGAQVVRRRRNRI